MDVSYKNLETLVEIMQEKNVGGAIFGSFALAYYSKLKNHEMQNIRDTRDIDIYVDNNEDLLTRLDDKIGQGVGITPENSYFIPCDVGGRECYLEIFPEGVLSGIDPKHEDRLDKEMAKEENQYKLCDGISVPKEWIWVALKMSASAKASSPKHINDLTFFKGLYGDEEFNEITEKIRNEGFSNIVESYLEAKKQSGIVLNT